MCDSKCGGDLPLHCNAVFTVLQCYRCEMCEDQLSTEPELPAPHTGLLSSSRGPQHYAAYPD